MMIRFSHTLLAVGCAAVVAAGVAWAGSVQLGAGSISADAGVKSLLERRFDGVVKQQFDYSCGSAALATLLTFHYELPSDEDQVFKYMYEHGDPEKIKVLGFSMKDMKEYVERLGFQADGCKISVDKVAEAGVPGITLLNTNGYRHFVVVKGISDRFVLLGDPALGLRTITRAEFESDWSGVFFMIRNKASIARFHFNKNEEWGVLASAPVKSGVDRSSLSGFTLSLPRRGDF